MDSVELSGTQWALVQFETDAGVIPALQEAPATLAFAPPNEHGEQVGRISGSGGCNRYFGGYALAGDQVSFSAMGSSRMMCSPERIAQENRFLQALQTAERCEVRGVDLLIVYVGGILRFTRAETS